MRSTYGEIFKRCVWLLRRRTAVFTFICLACISAPMLMVRVITPASAQGSFNSGSTGADGAFSDTVFPLDCTRTQNTITCTLRADGVFNFTTITIPSGITIKFNRNAKNTPVTMLASGNVMIAGIIDISGQDGTLNGPTSGGGVGGPGGSDGGRGGYPFASIIDGVAGDGPGGGGGGGWINGNLGSGGGGGFVNVGNDGGDTEIIGKGGPRYGSSTLLPLIGGSGGGGGPAINGTGGPGAGGGGAILIASSGAISFNSGSINARGGNGASTDRDAKPGGGGSGGAIRVVANSISGNGSFASDGGAGGFSGFFCNCRGGAGSSGYIRIEAFSFTNFQPIISPGPPQTSSSFGLPSSVALPNAPVLKIASVAGMAAPATPAGSFHGPADIVVPSAQANPVNVALQAANIPLGSIVQVTLTPETGAFTTVQSTVLAGTVAASTATASVNLPMTGMSVINATASYDLPAGNQRTSQMLIEGEHVKRVEVATTFGAQSEVTYITESGKRIKRRDQ